MTLAPKSTPRPRWHLAALLCACWCPQLACDGGPSVELFYDASPLMLDAVDDSLSSDVAQPPDELCDLQTALGCEAGESCVVRAQGGVGCVVAGDAVAGEACAQASSCGPGLVCSGPSVGRLCCTEWCMTDADCDGGEASEGACSLGSASGSVSLGTCQRLESSCGASPG